MSFCVNNFHRSGGCLFLPKKGFYRNVGRSWDQKSLKKEPNPLATPEQVRLPLVLQSSSRGFPGKIPELY